MELLVKKCNDQGTQGLQLGSGQPKQLGYFNELAAEDGDGAMIHDSLGATQGRASIIFARQQAARTWASRLSS